MNLSKQAYTLKSNPIYTHAKISTFIHLFIKMVCSCEVKLHGMWASPAVRRVEWALKMKGIEYDYIEEDLPNKSTSLLQHNPINKQVPVLVHDGKAMVESLVILEYIDEVWKTNPILPKDPHQRAMARFWATFVEDKCRAASKAAFFANGEEQDNAMRLLEEVIGTLDKELRGKKFFGGDNIGYLDLVAGWMAFWLGVAEEVACFRVVNPEKFPRFAAWISKFLQVPVIKQNLPPRDKTVEFFHNYRQIHLPASK